VADPYDRIIAPADGTATPRRKPNKTKRLLEYIALGAAALNQGASAYRQIFPKKTASFNSATRKEGM
jgi:hypothetical protein